MTNHKKVYKVILENPRVAEFHSRKKKSVSTQITLVSLLLIGVMTGSMLFYVWSRVKVVELNYAIVELTQLEQELLEQNRQFRLQLAAMTSPTRLDMMATNKFNMNWPTNEQIVRLK
ncbi:MAG: cell division protein FtsL [Deltaproteobacteria bacterium]|nr:cell division protein FtsL [Deltaproteobacteria bacterium]